MQAVLRTAGCSQCTLFPTFSSTDPDLNISIETICALPLPARQTGKRWWAGAALLTAFMSVTVAMGKSKPRLATCECSQSQQKDSGIKLVVVDQRGAVIPKAEIAVKGKSFREPVAGVTGSSGEWSLAKLTAGHYRVTVKAQGFRTFNSVIQIRDGILLALKVKMQVAAVNTTVEVKAEPVVIMGTAGILTEVHNSIPSAPSSGAGFSPMRQ
jgi:carboxypeptidase family protein